VVVVGLALLVAGFGCGRRLSAAELRGAEYSVRRVEFEGVTRFGGRELYEHLELRPLQWRPLPTRHWYYPGLLPSDAERIVALYHAHGYYEARVVDVEVTLHERRRRGRADITWTVEEGPVTRVDALVVRWPEGPPEGPPSTRPRRALGSDRDGAFVELPSLDPEDLSRKVTLTIGEAFEVPELLASSATLREALRRLGHPFVEVTQEARIDRAQRAAEVEFEVRPGPYLRIGEIEVRGLETVPHESVQRAVESLRGRPYSPARLDEIERRIYALGMFTSVLVEPKRPPAGSEREDPDGTLDILVRVHEAEPQRVRLGVALGFEPNRWEQRFAARYEHRNLFRDLYKLRLTGRAGYAELPSVVRPIAHGPVAAVDLEVQKQGLLEPQLVWTVSPSVELGVEQGYQFWSVRHRFGISRFFTRWFQAEISHNLRYVDFFNVAGSLQATDTLLGLDFRDPYILSFLAVSATVWAVDKMIMPNDGAVIGARYQVAGGPFGGHFDYQEITPFVRGYWRPLTRLQLATQVEIGMIFPYGDQPGAPIDMRRYLGGTLSVRGWGRRRLSPRVIDCPSDGSACESIPVGGNSSVLGNFEVRVLAYARGWAPVWLAAFLDIGDVQPGVAQFEPRQWNYAAGGGLRLDTPVGRFRLDVGVRLNETELGVSEPRWAFHFGLGESF
jgi:outer membrane protein assembly factor BamA